jgi:hypothetical protein
MIRCIRFRPYKKNTLRGFADFELSRVGLVLRDCPWQWHENSKQWVAFPARPYTDKSGATQWQALIEFAEGAKRAREEFQRQALEAIHRFLARRTGDDERHAQESIPQYETKNGEAAS